MILTTVKLLRRHWHSILRGHLPTIQETDIDSDGRTRAKTIRGMMAEGVLLAIPSTEEGRPPVYQATPTLIDAVPAVRPDLAVIDHVDSRDEFTLRHTHGVPLDITSTGSDRLNDVGHLRWIAEHRGDYRFTDPWGDRVDPVHYHRSETFSVRDDAYDAAVAARLLALRADDAARKSLAWGLKQIGALPSEEAAAHFKIETGDALLDSGNPGFGQDPKAWGEDATRIVDELHKRVTRDLAAITAITHANAYVLARGGWEAFVADYRERVTAAITERSKGETKP